jgi:hypothetical protein
MGGRLIGEAAERFAPMRRRWRGSRPGKRVKAALSFFRMQQKGNIPGGIVMVKIPYGKNQDGEKVSVEYVNKKDSYTYLKCGQPLILGAGEYAVKHFAHFRVKRLCPLLTRKNSKDNNIGKDQGFSQNTPFIFRES